jgi:hypothetical protein
MSSATNPTATSKAMGAWSNKPDLSKVSAPAKQEEKSKPTYVDPTDGFRNEARSFIRGLNLEELKKNDYNKTICFMFYNDGGNLKVKRAVAGLCEKSNQALTLKANRVTADIKDKETQCAEEVLLAAHPHRKFLFSWAYDTGLEKSKPACQAGCCKLLAKFKIEDLYY